MRVVGVTLPLHSTDVFGSSRTVFRRGNWCGVTSTDMTLSIVKTQIDFPKTARHNPFRPYKFRAVFLSSFLPSLCDLLDSVSPNRRHQMKEFVRSLWNDQEGQDIAEYAVMLAVILVIVVGTIRLVGGNANNVFSSVASTVN